VPAGRHTVEIVADDRLPARVELEAPASREFEVRLEPALTISGVVRFAEGTPLARGSVSATLEGDDPGRTTGVGVTGPDGSFTVGYLPAGTYRLLVTEGLSYSGAQRTELEGIAAGASGVVVTVGRSLSLRGRVVLPDGSPAPRTSVTASPASGRATGYANSRGDGSFEMDGLAPGEYEVVVRPPPGIRFSDYGVVLNSRWLGVRVAGVTVPRTDDLVLRLVAGLTISGTATDERGAPLAHRMLRAETVARDDPDAIFDSSGMPGVTTDAAGRFELTGLPAGTFRVVAPAAPGGGEKRPLVGAERVRAGTNGLQVRLGSYSSIEGIVVDGEGRGIASAEIRAVAAEGPGGAARGADDGTFWVRNLAAGAVFVLHARAPGMAPVRVPDVSSGMKGVRLVLTPGARAAGRLVDGEGKPLGSVQLVLETDATPFRVVAKTDADGRFEVDGLLPGARYEAKYFGQRGNRFDTWPCGTVTAGDEAAELFTGK
jgi:hypothetical protein